MRRLLIVLAMTLSIAAICLSIISGARFSAALWRGSVVFGGAFVIGLIAAVISVMAYLSGQRIPASGERDRKQQESVNSRPAGGNETES